MLIKVSGFCPQHSEGIRSVRPMLLLMAACSLSAVAALAAGASGQPNKAQGVNTAANPAADSGTPPAVHATPSHNSVDRFAGRAGQYYLGVWGIDSLAVRLMESGELVRFTYRVQDPVRAAPLNDKKNEPSLIDPRAGVTLVVPTMEKVGQLRQTNAPEAGRSYWLAFSNKGRPVKKGDRVEVVIGPFQAKNLVVD